MIKSIWNTLTNVGIHPNLSKSEQLALLQFNVQVLISSLISVPIAFVLLFWVNERYCLGVVILASGYLLALLANKYHYYSLAKYIFTFLGLINLFWGSASLGYYSYLHIIFILVGILGAVFYEGKGIKVFHFLVVTIGITILYETNFSLFLTDDISIEKQRSIGTVVLSLGFLSIVAVLAAVIFRMKEYENRLEKKNTALAKTTRELDFFVYSASHDLRAPLTTLLGLIDVMRIDPNNVAKYLGLQEKSIKKMDSFIIDLINYSHNARKDLQIEKVNLTEIAETVIQTQYLGTNLAHIKTSIQCTGDYTAYSDVERLSVIMNILISNAFRYHEPKRLNPFIKIRFTINPQNIQIEVEDNGIGIPEAHIEKIFQLFYRADSYKSGSGLGLYILKESVEKLNGNVVVVSQLNEGTTFKITIQNFSKPNEDSGFYQMAASF